jgi:hypothetical protein
VGFFFGFSKLSFLLFFRGIDYEKTIK